MHITGYTVISKSNLQSGMPSGAAAEIFLHFPNGVARTRLTNSHFDSVLQTTSTVRSWQTVLKLVELAASV